MKVKKPIILLLIAVLTISVAACSASKTYYGQSRRTFLNGEEIPADSSIESDQCYAVIDSKTIEFHYFNRVYKGTITNDSDSFVQWDQTPYLMDDIELLYSKLSEIDSDSYRLELSYRYDYLGVNTLRVEFVLKR